MKSAISLLLSFSVFACPFICHAGHVAVRPGEQVASCCSHSTTNTPSKSPAKLPSDQSNGCCRGICGGAVLDSSVAFAAGIDTSWSLPAAILAPVSLTSRQETQVDRGGAPPWPDDGANRGRV